MSDDEEQVTYDSEEERDRSERDKVGTAMFYLYNDAVIDHSVVDTGPCSPAVQ